MLQRCCWGWLSARTEDARLFLRATTLIRLFQSSQRVVSPPNEQQLMEQSTGSTRSTLERVVGRDGKVRRLVNIRYLNAQR